MPLKPVAFAHEYGSDKSVKWPFTFHQEISMKIEIGRLNSEFFKKPHHQLACIIPRLPEVFKKPCLRMQFLLC